jgi:KDO2-lipid IV(A) lauroyltransferase
MTLSARLALQTGAAVGMVWGERLPRGAGYAVHVMPLAEALPLKGMQDEETWMTAAAAAVNRSMETLIRARPSQYLWGYNRYKQPRRLDAS